MRWSYYHLDYRIWLDGTGVDKTRNRTRTGGCGLGLADADSDWRTRTRGPTKKIEKYLKKNKKISKDDAPTSFSFLKHQIVEHTA